MNQTLNPSDQFHSLSIKDLIEARELFHFHLMNKRNVIATAIGRYLIRNSDMQGKVYRPRKKYPREPRTLDKSQVQKLSWPCVIVFISKWEDESNLINSKYDNIIPKNIYMPDGRTVPICIVEAPRDFQVEPSADIYGFASDARKLQPGMPVMTPVQGRQYVSTIGCLVTNGHTTYALTNKHVTGELRKPIYSWTNGGSKPIGVTSGKVLGKKKFSEMYPGWSSNFVTINNDAGLIEVADTRDWSPEIYNIGQVDELFDLNIRNFTLDLIGKDAVAHGAVSGNMEGKIFALFYRYRSVGGEEFVSDFLIGGKDGNDLNTQHGDSGALWMIKEDGYETDDLGKTINRTFIKPFALLWGQHEFVVRGELKKSAYALCTCLSNVLRELDIDLIRSWNIEQDYTWGKVGHYTVGNKAIEAINGTKFPSLKKMFGNNVDRISFDAAAITKELDDTDNFATLYFGDFCPLADVPDLIWKQGPAGIRRAQAEHPNHYCDIDYKGKKLKKSLRDLVESNPNNLDTAVWVSYYKSIKGEIPRDPSDTFHKDDPNHPENHWGLLPFRVWQLFDEMVDSLKKNDRIRFFAAAGVLTHYVGDACQPLHGSYMTNGDTFRLISKVISRGDNKGKKVKEPYAKGVHGAYEDKMIDFAIGEIIQDLGNLINKQNKNSKERISLIKSGNDAAHAVFKLLMMTMDTLPPKKILDTYVKAKTLSGTISENMWNTLGDQTKEVLARGCRYLAAIWEGAWSLAAAEARSLATTPIDKSALKSIYENRETFARSYSIDKIATHLK